MLKPRILILLILITSLLATQGSSFAWENPNVTVSSFGGSANDVPNAIATDSLGNTYIGGYYAGTTDFNPTSSIDSATSNGAADAFIAKYSSTGNLLWAKNFGGTSDDQVVAIATDSSDNIYITGDFYGTVDFDYTSGIESLTANGSGKDIFITKISSTGERQWTKILGGPNVNDTAYAIALDSTGNVIVGGDFRGSVDFDPGAGTTTVNNATGYTDLFVLKLNSSGEFVWVKTVTNTQSNDQVLGISIFPNGEIVAVGGFGANTIPADFDPGLGSFTMSAGSTNHNIFIWKLNSDGTFGWAKNIGNSATADRAYSVAIDSSSNVYTTGTFQSSAAFSPAGETLTATSYDSFVVKHSSSGVFQWARQITGSGAEYGRSISVDSSSNVYVSGHFTASIDLDPSASDATATSSGSRDFYLTKLNSDGSYLWSKTLGSTGDDVFASIRLDPQGNVLSTGYIAAAFTVASGSNSFDVPFVGAVDGFYLCLTPVGNYSCGLSESTSSSEEQERKSREERTRLIAKARSELATSLSYGLTLTMEALIAADFYGVTEKNLILINDEIAKLSKIEDVDLIKLARIIRKHEVMGRIEGKVNVYYSELFESGLVSNLSPYRTMIMIKLRKLPKDALDSEEEIRAVIAATEKIYIDRNTKLKQTIERIKSRGK